MKNKLSQQTETDDEEDEDAEPTIAKKLRPRKAAAAPEPAKSKKEVKPKGPTKKEQAAKVKEEKNAAQRKKEENKAKNIRETAAFEEGLPGFNDDTPVARPPHLARLDKYLDSQGFEAHESPSASARPPALDRILAKQGFDPHTPVNSRSLKQLPTLLANSFASITPKPQGHTAPPVGQALSYEVPQINYQQEEGMEVDKDFDGWVDGDGDIQLEDREENAEEEEENVGEEEVEDGRAMDDATSVVDVIESEASRPSDDYVQRSEGESESSDDDMDVVETPGKVVVAKKKVAKVDVKGKGKQGAVNPKPGKKTGAERGADMRAAIMAERERLAAERERLDAELRLLNEEEEDDRPSIDQNESDASKEFQRFQASIKNSDGRAPRGQQRTDKSGVG